MTLYLGEKEKEGLGATIEILNKPGTAKVVSISKAQKAQSF